MSGGHGIVLAHVEAPQLPCSEWEGLLGRLSRAGEGEEAAEDPVSEAGTWPGREVWVSHDDAHKVVSFRNPTARSAHDELEELWTTCERVAQQHDGSVRSHDLELLPTVARVVDHDSAYLYLVQISPEPWYEAEFNRWYDEEHLPGLAGIEGVHAAHRFVCADGRGELLKYLAVYYLDCPSVRHRPQWRSAADTAWTARMHTLPRKKSTALFRRLAGSHQSRPHAGQPAQEG